MYTISEFAKLIHVSTGTLRRWDRTDILKPVYLGAGRHRRYTDEHLREIKNQVNKTDAVDERKNILYARESTKTQEKSLELQIEAGKAFMISKGMPLHDVISEFGSGMNYKRKKFLKLLTSIFNGDIGSIVISHKDRIVRFGFPMFEHICSTFGVNIIIIDESDSSKSKREEFADDLISIIHHFSMRLYGSRSYKKKIKEAEDNIKKIKQDV
jgi:predicted site-specific integrase-resolvase